jgi:uncharacterized protein with PQ loop repeat
MHDCDHKLFSALIIIIYCLVGLFLWILRAIYLIRIEKHECAVENAKSESILFMAWPLAVVAFMMTILSGGVTKILTKYQQKVNSK